VTNIWMLVAANLRKNKGQTISLMAFVLLASLLLNTGLVLLTGIGAFFDNKAESNHAAHITEIYAPGAASIEQGHAFMENDARVTEIEKTQVIGSMGDYYIGETKSMCFSILAKIDAAQTMDSPSLVGDSKPLTGDAIYIPSFIMFGGNYQIGDPYTLVFAGIELHFTIAGATEEIMFGAQLNNVHRFYIPDEKYNELVGQLPGNNVILLSARLENAGDVVFFQADYNKAVSKDGLFFDFILNTASQARTMVPMIAATVMTAFALILLIVSLIVIRFRITHGIEESMVNIGTQKAVGFRNRQIISAILIQYAAVAFVGGIVGVTLAQFAIPAIMSIMKPMMALEWKPSFDLSAAAVAVIVLLFAVAATTWITSRKINKLHPLIALRGGVTTHSFRKNPLPLDKTRGGLSLLLSLKQLLQNKKQALTITVIIAVVTMASVAGVGVNYNLSERKDHFAAQFFGEIPSTGFTLKDDVGTEENAAFKEAMTNRDEVRKIFGYMNPVQLLVDDKGILAAVVEDCSLLEGNMLISGRYPKHSNEIALGSSILKVSGKKVGDTVMVKSGDIEKEYIVTGLVQFMNNNGFNGIIAAGSLRSVCPDFEFKGYNVYLNDGIDTNDFIKSVESSYENFFDTVMNAEEQIKGSLESMGVIFAFVAAGIVGLTIFVVILVLYMVIKTIILRRRHELGIQKALGFTTFQLMNQIALNMTPSILIGAVLGAIAGFAGLNPMMAAFMGSMGIVKVYLLMPLDQTVIICAALIILAYTVSLLIAWRIRKISAYALISE